MNRHVPLSKLFYLRLISVTTALLLKPKHQSSRIESQLNLKRNLITCDYRSGQTLVVMVSFFNFSHHVLSEVEKNVLSRGLRFCLSPKEVDTYEVKCSFELLFRDLTRFNLGLHALSLENRDRLRSRLQNSRIFCERERRSIFERKVWSKCKNGEGE